MSNQQSPEPETRGSHSSPPLGSVRPTVCPQCGDPIVQTSFGPGGKTDDYCENCGWPDEDRREKIDMLVQWLAKRLQHHREWKPAAEIPGWMRDKHMGRVCEAEEVLRAAIDIRGCIYPGTPCCRRPADECKCESPNEGADLQPPPNNQK